MKTKPFLTTEDVDCLLTGAREEARRNHWIVSISVVDDGGHPLGHIRLDGATALSAYISMEKARAAAIGRKETRHFESMINEGRIAFLSAPLNVMLEGGVPIIHEGHIIGAVGVSGVQSALDAKIAQAAIYSLLE